MNSQSLPDNILRCMEPARRKSLGKAGRTSEEIEAVKALKLEREIHRDIEQWLRSKEIVFQHERMDGKTRGTVGWPDFTFVWKGAAMIGHSGMTGFFPIGCEVKRPGEKPTEDQAKVHDHMRRNGWTVLVVYSLHELIEELKKL